jgi:purine-binding chemotaxis protein CheW
MKKRESRFLIFGMGDESYVLALEDVEEIMDPPQIYPLPKAPPYYSGIMNCHGMPTPVLDVEAFYKKIPSRLCNKILVLDRKKANLALGVHSVDGITSGAIVLEPDSVNSEKLEKTLVVADGRIKLLVTERLLKILEEEAKTR